MANEMARWSDAGRRAADRDPRAGGAPGSKGPQMACRLRRPVWTAQGSVVSAPLRRPPGWGGRVAGGASDPYQGAPLPRRNGNRSRPGSTVGTQGRRNEGIAAPGTVARKMLKQAIYARGAPVARSGPSEVGRRLSGSVRPCAVGEGAPLRKAFSLGAGGQRGWKAVHLID